MKTIIVWFRNDLRVHDHPALAKAVLEADYVIPVFIFDDHITNGRHSSQNRNRFLLECLNDVKRSLQKKGADLVVCTGTPEQNLKNLARDYSVDLIYYTADYTAGAVKRDRQIEAGLQKSNIHFRGFAGRLIISDHSNLRAKNGNVYKVFTPFWKNWQQIERRKIAETIHKISLPPSITIGSIPTLESLGGEGKLSPDVDKGGETEARKRLKKFLDDAVHQYPHTNNTMAKNGTSRLSPYFHFGCLSPLDVEAQLGGSDGEKAWARQLAWREFYHYIIHYFPHNSRQEMQERYQQLEWSHNKTMLHAWKQGMTGYPVVDASMRQLEREGWMHNRARLIVGSFLTKDLWLDWRDGECWFMQMLLDGDEANNNGNWQWIAGTGVDPAPAFRRLYNPSSQQTKFDPKGRYIYQFVSELKKVPVKYLAEPWKMTHEEQTEYDCIIGKDYPEPIVDHKEARAYALEQFRQTA